jgi:hypothetical protein
MSDNKPVFIKVKNVKGLVAENNSGFGNIDMFDLEDAEDVRLNNNQLISLRNDVPIELVEKIVSKQIREALLEIQKMNTPKDIHDYLQSLGAIGTIISAAYQIICS